MQLLAVGLTASQIDRALAAGRLRPLFRGAYAVGHAAVTTEGWCRAALLVCGDEATLGEHTACHLWTLRRGEALPPSVLVPDQHGRKQNGIRTRRARLQRTDWMTLDGLRLTTPARTIADMARHLSPRELRRLVERAQDLRRFNAREIRAVLDGDRTLPGRRPLLDLLRLLEPSPDGARSHLERLFLALVRRHRLPRPEVNASIEGRRRDFVWRDRRLVIEVDGYAYHSSARAIRRDRARDRDLSAAGWRPARFTYEEVALDPEYTADELRRLL